MRRHRTERRWPPIAILALLLLPLGPGPSPVGGTEAPWTPTGPLPAWDQAIRGSQLGGFTATVLMDGRVLAVGGFTLDEGARYDPATDAWTPTAPLRQRRYRHAATMLPGGDVLVGGGWGPCCSSARGSNRVERYNPATDTWTMVAPMREQRADHTMTLLHDGTVLVTGGNVQPASPGGGARQVFASAERYDPATDTWRDLPPMAAPRTGHTATRLADGSVLVVGGDEGGTAERYDPAANQWSAAGTLAAPRAAAAATLLHDGGVLITGGVGGGPILASAERYQPTANSFAPVAAMATPRQGHSATLLTDGAVIVAGGTSTAFGTEASAERFDPATGRWTPLPALGRARTGHGAALIGGRVLVVGGENADPASSAEWYDPATPGRCFAETGRCLRGAFLDHWQAHGGLAINGYPLSEEFPERLEDGKVYRVQYFERVRMEYHPENAAPNDVLLGQFGRRIHPADPPIPRPSGPMVQNGFYFAETGHYVGGLFFNFWYTQGGLAQYGYPLTEEFDEILEDGKTYKVQYFERARFEHHPENPSPSDVLLGQFGRRILNGR